LIEATENLPIKEGNAVLITPMPAANDDGNDVEKQDDEAVVACINSYLLCEKLQSDVVVKQENLADHDLVSDDTTDIFSWFAEGYSWCFEPRCDNGVSFDQVVQYTGRKCREEYAKDFVPPKTLGRLNLKCIGASDLTLGTSWRRIAVSQVVIVNVRTFV